MTDQSLHRTFILWPLRLLVISVVVILATLCVVPVSKLFIGAGVLLGILHSLSTMEELTGGRELNWISTPVVLAGDAFLTVYAFAGITFVQSIVVFLQFLAVIILSESVVIYLLHSKLQTFCARRS
jgi:hypothetical protein